MSKVFLIAGHKGRGTGASSKWLDEGAETIVLRDLISLNLTRAGFMDFTLDDGTEEIGERSTLSVITKYMKGQVKKDDVCIDIHFNASSSPLVSGCEVFIPNKASETECVLADRLLTAICTTLDVRNRGVKNESSSQHNKLAMLSSFDCVNILLEICFCSNESDCNNYYKNRERLATEISQVILDFIKWKNC